MSDAIFFVTSGLIAQSSQPGPTFTVTIPNGTTPSQSNILSAMAILVVIPVGESYGVVPNNDNFNTNPVHYTPNPAGETLLFVQTLQITLPYSFKDPVTTSTAVTGNFTGSFPFYYRVDQLFADAQFTNLKLLLHRPNDDVIWCTDTNAGNINVLSWVVMDIYGQMGSNTLILNEYQPVRITILVDGVAQTRVLPFSMGARRWLTGVVSPRSMANAGEFLRLYSSILGLGFNSTSIRYASPSDHSSTVMFALNYNESGTASETMEPLFSGTFDEAKTEYDFKTCVYTFASGSTGGLSSDLVFDFVPATAMTLVDTSNSITCTNAHVPLDYTWSEITDALKYSWTGIFGGVQNVSNPLHYGDIQVSNRNLFALANDGTQRPLRNFETVAASTSDPRVSSQPSPPTICIAYQATFESMYLTPGNDQDGKTVVQNIVNVALYASVSYMVVDYLDWMTSYGMVSPSVLSSTLDPILVVSNSKRQYYSDQTASIMVPSSYGTFGVMAVTSVQISINSIVFTMPSTTTISDLRDALSIESGMKKSKFSLSFFRTVPDSYFWPAYDDQTLGDISTNDFSGGVVFINLDLSLGSHYVTATNGTRVWALGWFRDNAKFAELIQKAAAYLGVDPTTVSITSPTGIASNAQIYDKFAYGQDASLTFLVTPVTSTPTTPGVGGNGGGGAGGGGGGTGGLPYGSIVVRENGIAIDTELVINSTTTLLNYESQFRYTRSIASSTPIQWLSVSGANIDPTKTLYSLLLPGGRDFFELIVVVSNGLPGPPLSLVSSYGSILVRRNGIVEENESVLDNTTTLQTLETRYRVDKGIAPTIVLKWTTSTGTLVQATSTLYSLLPVSATNLDDSFAELIVTAVTTTGGNNGGVNNGATGNAVTGVGPVLFVFAAVWVWSMMTM